MRARRRIVRTPYHSKPSKCNRLLWTRCSAAEQGDTKKEHKSDTYAELRNSTCPNPFGHSVNRKRNTTPDKPHKMPDVSDENECNRNWHWPPKLRVGSHLLEACNKLSSYPHFPKIEARVAWYSSTPQILTLAPLARSRPPTPAQ